MLFSKFPHPLNFSFGASVDPDTKRGKVGTTEVAITTATFEGDVHRIRVSCPERWSEPRRVIELNSPIPTESAVALTESFSFELADDNGAYLVSAPGKGFGASGSTWMMAFAVRPDARFFGMGEKFFGKLELSGTRTKFYNTDVWGDFHWAQWLNHTADPPYLSVPYLIVREGGTYTGILVNSGFPAYFETPGIEGDRVFMEWQQTSPHLIIGSEGGEPDVWIIRGPDLPALTRKLQKLVGTTPVPPLWSLGYHQSRWGYAGEKDLFNLNDQFLKTDIPCDGLWLDIDYMEGYRIFTIDESHFPSGVETVFQKLRNEGRRVVAILDPGIKIDNAYAVYNEGTSAGYFCKNPEGNQYTGLVWPGETVFPDFTLAEVRHWWASHVSEFYKRGFGGFWVDMNDPSTGPVDPGDMLFNHGKESHLQQRNDYALGMQMATFEGMLKAKPDERPFILSRSGSQGTSRYAAVWTGDNYSNYHYLRLTVPTSLNLSLSGIPFNGPDLGGFGGDVSEELMLHWMKTCFLFPFTRCHTGNGTRKQEPWEFSAEAEAVLRKYIRLRYRLLPYLYNLFCEQEELGDPVLRPLFYEFSGNYDSVVDQFLVGPSILQAPIMKKGGSQRKLTLPGRDDWFDAASGEWVDSGRTRREPAIDETPMFVRNGSIIPMQAEGGRDLRNVEFHVFAEPGTIGETTYTYRADDGLTYGYKRGERTILRLQAEWNESTILLQVEPVDEGYGSITPIFVLHAGERKCMVNGTACDSKEIEVSLAGKPFSACRIVLLPVEERDRLPGIAVTS